MDIFIYDSDMNLVTVIDEYESLIWTERYSSYGDFELYLGIANDDLSSLDIEIKTDDPEDYKEYYIRRKESDRIMLIESKKLETDSEDGDHVTLQGRSIESVLERRIVWNRTEIRNLSFQNGIKKLLDENLISPSDGDRKISGFVFRESTDEKILGLDKIVTKQVYGDNLYEVIKDLCDERNVGFKITLNDENQFEFQLYSGTNRSQDQNDVPHIVFSPGFENLSTSEYKEDVSNHKNVALIAGDGEGALRKTTSIGASRGYARRELFVDARDLSSDDVDPMELTENGITVILSSSDVYLRQLKQRGSEKLAECTFEQQFEGEILPLTTYIYGRDFFLGDITQVVNEYGLSGTVRVDEVVVSSDGTGESVLPTFIAAT